MVATLAAFPKGHQFPAVAFDLTEAWIAEYIAAVEDEGIAALDGAVPPMAVAALCIRALLESAGLPDGAIHAGQELALHRSVKTGERLVIRATVASRGERQGRVLTSVDLAVENESGGSVMTGRATVTFPVDPSAAVPEAEGRDERPLLPTAAADAHTIIKTITQAKIDRYGDASGDHNPLHVDPAFAASTRFGGTIAHGMLVLASISELMEVAYGDAWIRSGRLKVRFRGAARPGDTVTATRRVSRTDGRNIVCDVECRNPAGEILISGTAEVLDWSE